MKKIIIISAGGHALELLEYIEYINDVSKTKIYDVLGFIDVSKESYNQYKPKYSFIGLIKEHTIKKDAYYILGVGDIKIRELEINAFKKKGAKFETIIHPTALISKTATIGEGSVISHNASVGPHAKIGPFNLINSRCTIGHDSIMGTNNFLSPQVVLGGNSELGNGNMMGTNSCVLPKISVGDNNTIMAGMVLSKKVEDNETVFYRYKEKVYIKSNKKNEQ